MKQYIIKIVAVAISVTASLHARANKLVDAETKTVLPLASISDHSGNMIGMTSREGEIPPIASNCFPITFNYMGYKPLEVERLDGSDVIMYQSLYELPEILVTPGSRPLLHLTGYMREVASMLGSSDSLTIYKESIVDFLIPVGKTREKVWSKPRVLASKTYVRMSDSSGMDSVSCQLDEKFLLRGDRYNFIPSVKAIPESMKVTEGSARKTIMGKYSPKHIWEKNGETTRWYFDGLADREGHVYTPRALKVAGMTSDLKEASFNYVFHTDEGNTLKHTDMTRVSLSIDLLVRGKVAKKAYKSTGPLHLRTYIEVYLTEREYLTDAEGKAIKKEAPVYRTSDVKAPADATPLHPGIARLIERVNAQQTKN